MLFAALVLIGHYPSAALFVFSEQLKLVVDSSMATSLIFGLVAGVLCASHTVAREMRNGTVLLLLSKPVYRWTFVLGKIIGIALAVTLFAAVCNFAAVISVYVATDQFRMDMGIYYIYLALLAAGCVVGMVANFWKGSSFSEIASYALTLLVPVFAVYCLMAKPEPTLALADLGKALILINFAVIAMSTLAGYRRKSVRLLGGVLPRADFQLSVPAPDRFGCAESGFRRAVCDSAELAVFLAGGRGRGEPADPGQLCGQRRRLHGDLRSGLFDVGRRDLPEQGDRRGQPRVTGLSVRFSVAAVFTAAFL